MRLSGRLLVRGVLVALLSLIVALLICFVSLQLHVAVYAWINPAADIEIDHNIHLAGQLSAHVKILLPLLSVLCGWFFWRFFKKRA